MRTFARIALTVFGSLLGGIVGGMLAEHVMMPDGTRTLPVPQPVATPTPSSAPTTGSPWTFGDPRFRLVKFREDELLDVPLIAETFRIARIKLGMTGGEPRSAYDSLFRSPFTEGFAVISRYRDGQKTHVVILGSGAKSGNAQFIWELPSIHLRADDEPLLWYNGNGHSLEFTEADGRLILTSFGTMVYEGQPYERSAESLENVTSLTYYRPAEGLWKITDDELRRRLAFAKRLLEEMHSRAIAAAPHAAGLRRPVDLDWSPSESGYAACVTPRGVNGLTPVRIGVETLWAYSENHLRQVFGHELGHVVRDHAASGGACTDLTNGSDCQLAAEAFSLKLLGDDVYRRVQTIAMGKTASETEELMTKLRAINERFPNS